MARPNSYVDLKGCEFSLSELDAEERKLVAELQARYNRRPDWNEFENYWTRAVAALYGTRGLTRRESRQKAVYRDRPGPGQSVGRRGGSGPSAGLPR